MDGRSHLAPLMLLALLAAACGAGQRSATDGPAEAVEQVTYRYIAGECQQCGFELVVTDDGATFASNGLVDELAVDTDRFRAALADESALTLGDDDCGREVDGNAPILTTDVEIDFCFHVPNDDHPLVQLVRELEDEGRSTQPLPTFDIDVTVPTTPPADLAAGSWPELIDPDACPSMRAEATLPSGPAWLAVQDDGDRCLVWIGAAGDPARQRCAFPTNHVPVGVRTGEDAPLELALSYESQSWCLRT